MKKELAIAALRDGTVIDHIPPSALFRIVDLLGLASLPNTLTIANNLPSAIMGSKGLLKIADYEFAGDDIHRIALLAPGAVINVIRDYRVVSKEGVRLPAEITGIAVCPNPKCITRNEPMAPRFHTLTAPGEPTRLRCHYCEHEFNPFC